MKKYLDKTLLNRYLDLVVASSIMIFGVLLVLMNNLDIFKAIPLTKLPLKEIIVKKYFSMSFINFVILYLFYSLVIVLFFKDSKKELREVKNGKYTTKQCFFTKTLCILISILVPIILNTLIKFIAYRKYHEVYQDKLNIGVSVIVIFLIFQIMLAIFSIGTLMVSQLLFQDLLKGAIFPVLLGEFIVTTFGINSLFISEKLHFIRTIINPIKDNVVDKLIDAIFWDGRVELQQPELQGIVIVGMLILAITFLIIAYFLLRHNLDNKTQSKYNFKTVRIIYHIILSIMIGIYIPAAVAYFIAFTKPDITLEYATYIFNIVALAIIPIIFIFILEKPIWRFFRKEKLES